MRPASVVLACAVLGLATAIAPRSAIAQDVAPPAITGQVRVVGFIDTKPASTAAAISVLKRYDAAAEREPGAIKARLYREIARPERLMLVETWRDQAAYDRHAASMARLNRALAPLALGPADIRTHRAFLGTGPRLQAPASAVTVMTHLDVAPPFFAALQKALAPYVAAIQTRPGALSIEVLQHTQPRQNHLTAMETWSSTAAFDAARRDPMTWRFRAGLLPISGALYDERIYRSVD